MRKTVAGNARTVIIWIGMTTGDSKTIVKKTMKDGFYCKRMGDKFISEFFNNERRNGIIIPDWCPFKCKEEKQTTKWEMVDDDVCLDSFDIYDD